MAGIGKQFKGSGIAKSGFSSKHEQSRDHLKSGGLTPIGNLKIPRRVKGELDMLASGGKVRKHYEGGSDQEGVQPDRNEAEQKEYNDTYKQRVKKYEDEKTYYQDRDSTVGPKVNKFLAKYVDDPITYAADKLLPENKRASRWDEADRKARKDVLGYKKGGSAKPGLYANINRRKELGISRSKSKSTISPEAYKNMQHGFKKGGSSNWIQGAIKHPGALRASLHVKAGEKIPAKKLAAAAKKSGVMGRRARLAQTLRGFKK